MHIDYAVDSLLGLAVGDGFGEHFFGTPSVAVSRLIRRELPPGPWRVTDDTVMSIGVLRWIRRGSADSAELARLFARNYAEDPRRGYGRGAHGLLAEIAAGGDPAEAASAMFDGTGSMGNGSAMRVAPVGAAYFDDMDTLRELAIASSRATHCHVEGIHGALAVAFASGAAVQQRIEGRRDGEGLLRDVIGALPEGRIRTAVTRALEFHPSDDFARVARILGTGEGVIARDTVPFALWSASRHLANFEAAMWSTASGLGDVDTTCAIVGGIVGAHLGRDAIPSAWASRLEELGDRFGWREAISAP